MGGVGDAWQSLWESNLKLEVQVEAEVDGGPLATGGPRSKVSWKFQGRQASVDGA